MKKQGRILVVDDDLAILNLAERYLSNADYDVNNCQKARDAIKLLKEKDYDLIVIDNLMPEISGLDLAKHASETYRNIEIVVTTGVPDKVTIDAFRDLGISYFVFKPFHEAQFVYTIHAALHHARQIQRLISDDKSSASGNKIIGISSYCRQIRSEIGTFASSNISVLIVGETGTGKDVIANNIHKEGKCNNAPMIPVNCATLGSLADSEFFGHAKGAFTGAVRSSEGYIGSADGGTIFLDEVSELPIETQAKLLRFLDIGEYIPVGESKPKKADVRIICASNSDLKGKVNEGSFREDLYYRIAGAVIQTMPLRSRKEDIPPLVWHFIELFSNVQNKTFRISPHAANALSQYCWPGNVRQLKQIIHTLTQRCLNREITYADVVHEIGPTENVIAQNYREMKEEMIKEFDKTYFSNLLLVVQGSLKKTLEISGMHKKNFYEKLKLYGLSVK